MPRTRFSAEPTSRSSLRCIAASFASTQRIFGSLDIEESLALAALTAPNKRPLERVCEMFPRLKERRGSRGTGRSGGEQRMLAVARARAQSEDHRARRAVQRPRAGDRASAHGDLPRRGFFDCAGRLGRFAGDPDGQDTRTYHANELNAAFAYWGCAGDR